MKILLIQPSERPVLTREKTRGSIMPPLGLIFLANIIKQQLPEVTLELRDYEANPSASREFANYDIVGLTGTSVHMPDAYALVKKIREDNETALIIMGGPHATFCHEELLRDLPELDAVCRGEGEVSFVKFLQSYNGDRCNIPVVEGISTRTRLSAKLSPVMENLDDIGHIDLSMISWGKYRLSTHRKSLNPNFASLITSRGCPYHCNYCQTPKMFGSRLRYNSPQFIYETILDLKENYGIKSIVFWDDTFTADKQRTVDICKLLSILKIEWMCNTRVECVDKSLLQKMYKAGCKEIFFGVESSVDCIIKKMNRSATSLKDQTVKAFTWCRETGIETIGTIMIGAPDDTNTTIQENIEYLQSLKPNHVYISIYNVTPGSADYKRAMNDGTIKQIKWGDSDNFRGSPYGLPTVNPRLSRGELQNYQSTAYRLFNSEKEYE